MFLKFTLQKFSLIVLLCLATTTFGKDYIIYNIAQDIPMGTDNEVIKKNYYVNIGSKQGLKSGTHLDVYRLISILDPYKSKKRYNYRVKIGELEVLHAEDNSSITSKGSFRIDEQAPYLEVDDFMIGDQVNVSIND